MPNIRTLQRSFGSGILGPEMAGRSDYAKYLSGLAVCRNFIVKPQGPVENRAGFGFVNHTKSGRARLIPFTFATTQTMTIEMSAGTFRFHTEGATLLDGDGAPYEVGSPYAEEDLFSIHFVQSADVLTLVHPKYPPKELRRYGATDWRLEDIAFLPPILPPSLGPVGSSNSHSSSGTAASTYTYVATAVALDGVQESAASAPVSATNNLLISGAYNSITFTPSASALYYNIYKAQSGVYGYIGKTESGAFTDDNITPDMAKTPPVYDNPFTGDGIASVTVTNGGAGYGSQPDGGGLAWVGLPGSLPSGYVYSEYLSVSVVDTNGQGAVISATVERGTGFWAAESFPASRIILSINAPGRGYVNPTIKLHDNGYTTPTWSDEGGSGGGNLIQGPDLTLQYSLTPMVGAVRASVSDPTGTGAVIEPVVSGSQITGIEVLSPGTGYTNPSIVVDRPLGGAGAVFAITTTPNGDYPGAVSYFEQRRVFAGTSKRPQHLWMTKSGTESNMSYSLPTRDDDRISVRAAARESNTIRHAVPLNQLMLLTSSAEWRVSPVNSDAITPTTISVRTQSYIGASDVQPVIVNNALLYIAARGGHVRELGYNWQANGYVTGDLSLPATELFDTFDIVDMAYSKAPYPIVWFVSSNGKLLGLTYVPEQQIGAWHVHDTDGAFESCCVVAEGLEDVLYCVIRREINGETVRTIERMASRLFADPKDAFFVDCGGTLTSEAPVTTVSGLNWLEGKTVSILADGAVHPQRTVENGTVVLDHPASVVHVGLPVESEIGTLPFVAQIDNGFGQGRTKNVNKAWLRVFRSSGIWAGASEGKLRFKEYKQRTTEPYATPPRLVTDEVEITLEGNWGRDGALTVRQSDPLPLTVVSMTYEIALGG
jgi:hypothetical protein